MPGSIVTRTSSRPRSSGFFSNCSGTSVALLWDSGRQHRSVLVRDFIQAHPRLCTYRFPGYAPELNPDEYVWSHLKRAVANSVPSDLGELKRLLHPPLQRLRQSQKLLWACIYASNLPWR